MRITIESCGVDDAALLARLREATFRETYSSLTEPESMEEHVRDAFTEEQLVGELQAEGSTSLLARADGEPAGFMTLNEWSVPSPGAEPGGIEIEALYLLRRFQGLGIGGRLLGLAFERAGDAGANYVWMQVWERNERGRSFWRSQGFVEVGTRPFSFAGETHRDLVMRKGLAGDAS